MATHAQLCNCWPNLLSQNYHFSGDVHLNSGPQYGLNQTNEGLINTFSSLKSQTNLEVLIRHVNVRGLRNNLSHVKVPLEYSCSFGYSSYYGIQSLFKCWGLKGKYWWLSYWKEGQKSQMIWEKPIFWIPTWPLLVKFWLIVNLWCKELKWM